VKGFSIVGQTALWVLISVGVSGCMSTTPQWDQRFGESLTQIKAQQILHPVPAPADPQAGGMDAQAAVRAQNQYLHSFDVPVEPQSADMRR
jgi:hypothetical protein